MAVLNVTISDNALTKLIGDLEQIPARIPAVLAGALNDTGKKTVTQLSKRIRERVRIKKKDIDPHLRLQRASASASAETMSARITVSESARISLKYFGARQTAKGVTYAVATGKRSLIPSGFIVETLGGHVFKRTSKARLPITKLHGPSPWGVVVKAGLDDEALAFAEDELTKQLDRRVNFELLKASGAIGGR